MKKFLMTTAALAALFAAPAQTSSTLHLDHFAFMTSAEAGNSNGHGNGNGNGGNPSNPERGNAGANGKGSDNSNANNGNGPNSGAGSNSESQGLANAQQGRAIQNTMTKEKNVNAVLGRINSLGRNVDAIMLSKDPHLTAIRAYIVNGAELAKAETLADAAQAQYDAALTALSSAGLAGDPIEILASLTLEYTPELQATDPAHAQELAGAIDLVKSLISAETDLTAANARVAQLSVLASDAALAEALVTMSNHTLSDIDISAEMLDWSKAVLGVGDATGAIDIWIAKAD